MLKLGCCLPPPYKISGYAHVCTAGIYHKILRFVIDFIYVVLWVLVEVNVLFMN